MTYNLSVRHKVIARHLLKRGYITPQIAHAEYAMDQLPAVIKLLREKHKDYVNGRAIKTTMKQAESGRRYAYYELAPANA